MPEFIATGPADKILEIIHPLAVEQIIEKIGYWQKKDTLGLVVLSDIETDGLQQTFENALFENGIRTHEVIVRHGRWGSPTTFVFQPYVSRRA